MTYPSRKRPFRPDELPQNKPVPSIVDWFFRNISGAGFWEWYVDQVDPDGEEEDVAPDRGMEQDKPGMQ